MIKRVFIVGIISTVMISVLFFPSAWAQKTVRLSISTGGIGGVTFPIGGGMASIITKNIPYAEATVEVTTGSVDSCRLVGGEKAELGLVMADMALYAYQGKGVFKEKLPLRTIAILYPQNMHLVTLEGKRIDKVADLKGKRVSTGAPGSGTEVKALRIMEAYGLNPDKDMTRDKLGAAESSGALKDRKIDAYFFDGGYPVSTVTDLAATPGMKIKLIGQAEAIPKMREKYGPLYVQGIIPAKTYPGQEVDVPIAVVWNILVVNEKMKENVVYDILKVLFDHKPELVATHREGVHFSLERQAGNSPIPFHPGAIRYYREKGLKVE